MSEPQKTTANRVVRNTLIFLIAVGVGAVAFVWVQAKFDSTTSVPREVRAYIAGGGVAYAPAGQGYSVRLPAVPLRRDGRPATVHRSIVTGPNFEIVVRETDLPSASALENGLAGAVYDPKYSGTPELVNVHRVSFAGQPAFAFDAGLSSGTPVRSRLFIVGKRLFLISVQSESADDVFSVLSRSFHLRN